MAGQDLKGVRVALADDFQRDLQASGLGDQFAGIPGIGPGQPDVGAAAAGRRRGPGPRRR